MGSERQNQLDRRTDEVGKQKSNNAGGNMSIREQAEAQLSSIQAEQQAQVQEFKHQNVASRNTMSTAMQAAQLATAGAIGSATTAAILKKYGGSLPKRTTQTSQQVGPGNVVVNNTTTNNTTNVVGAGSGGNESQGKFKTWLINLSASQREEAQKRDIEYEKRESRLAKSAERMFKKIQETGKSFAEAMNPQKIGSSVGNQFRTILFIFGATVFAKFADKVFDAFESVAGWVGNIAKFFGIGSSAEGSSTSRTHEIKKSPLYQGLLTFLGADSLPTKYPKSLWGCLKALADNIGEVVSTKFESFAEQAKVAIKNVKKPDTSIWNIGESISGLIDYLGNVMLAVFSPKKAAAVEASNKIRAQAKESEKKTGKDDTNFLGKDYRLKYNKKDKNGDNFLTTSGDLRNTREAQVAQSKELLAIGKAAAQKGEIDTAGTAVGLERLEFSIKTNKNRKVSLDQNFIKTYLSKTEIEALKSSGHITPVKYKLVAVGDDEKKRNTGTLTVSNLDKPKRGWKIKIVPTDDTTTGVNVVDGNGKQRYIWLYDLDAEGFRTFVQKGFGISSGKINLEDRATVTKIQERLEALAGGTVKAREKFLNKNTKHSKGYKALDIGKTFEDVETVSNLQDYYRDANLYSGNGILGNLIDSAKSYWNTAANTANDVLDQAYASSSSTSQRAANAFKGFVGILSGGKLWGGIKGFIQSAAKVTIPFNIKTACGVAIENTNYNPKTGKRKSPTKSAKMCARAVKTAIARGLGMEGHLTSGHACNMPDILPSYGFQAISPERWNPQNGDVLVFAPCPGHQYGHVCMKTQRGWVSDFLQPDAYAGVSGYKTNNCFVAFRHINATNTPISSIGEPGSVPEDQGVGADLYTETPDSSTGSSKSMAATPGYLPWGSGGGQQEASGIASGQSNASLGGSASEQLSYNDTTNFETGLSSKYSGALDGTHTGVFQNKSDFVRTLFNEFSRRGISPNIALAMTAQSALESGWGQKGFSKYSNYGGITYGQDADFRAGKGANGIDFAGFNNLSSYVTSKLSILNRNFPGAIKADTIPSYFSILQGGNPNRFYYCGTGPGDIESLNYGPNITNRMVPAVHKILTGSGTEETEPTNSSGIFAGSTDESASVVNQFGRTTHTEAPGQVQTIPQSDAVSPWHFSTFDIPTEEEKEKAREEQRKGAELTDLYKTYVSPDGTGSVTYEDWKESFSGLSEEEQKTWRLEKEAENLWKKEFSPEVTGIEMNGIGTFEQFKNLYCGTSDDKERERLLTFLHNNISGVKKTRGLIIGEDQDLTEQQQNLFKLKQFYHHHDNHDKNRHYLAAGAEYEMFNNPYYDRGDESKKKQKQFLNLLSQGNVEGARLLVNEEVNRLHETADRIQANGGKVSQGAGYRVQAGLMEEQANDIIAQTYNSDVYSTVMSSLGSSAKEAESLTKQIAAGGTSQYDVAKRNLAALTAEKANYIKEHLTDGLRSIDNGATSGYAASEVRKANKTIEEINVVLYDAAFYLEEPHQKGQVNEKFFLEIKYRCIVDDIFLTEDYVEAEKDRIIAQYQKYSIEKAAAIQAAKDVLAGITKNFSEAREKAKTNVDVAKTNINEYLRAVSGNDKITWETATQAQKKAASVMALQDERKTVNADQLSALWASEGVDSQGNAIIGRDIIEEWEKGNTKTSSLGMDSTGKVVIAGTEDFGARALESDEVSLDEMESAFATSERQGDAASVDEVLKMEDFIRDFKKEHPKYAIENGYRVPQKGDFPKGEKGEKEFKKTKDDWKKYMKYRILLGELPSDDYEMLNKIGLNSNDAKVKLSADVEATKITTGYLEARGTKMIDEEEKNLIEKYRLLRDKDGNVITWDQATEEDIRNARKKFLDSNSLETISSADKDKVSVNVGKDKTDAEILSELNTEYNIDTNDISEEDKKTLVAVVRNAKGQISVLNHTRTIGSGKEATKTTMSKIYDMDNNLLFTVRPNKYKVSNVSDERLNEIAKTYGVSVSDLQKAEEAVADNLESYNAKIAAYQEQGVELSTINSIAMNSMQESLEKLAKAAINDNAINVQVLNVDNGGRITAVTTTPTGT